MTIHNMNNEVMKTYNAKTVLQAIQENEPISRKKLSDMTGLTSSSITNIVNRLVKKGFLEEVGLGHSSGGRKPILMRLNPKAMHIIGIDLGVEKITGIITNFRAKKIHKICISTNLREGKERVILRIIDLIKDLMEATEIKSDKVLGIGVAAPGPYDHETGMLLTPPNFPGWVNVPISSIIEENLKIPVYLEKETVASALGEFMFGGAKGVKSLFVINSMTVGLGGGILIDGKIYHGFSDGAGDLGHMTIDIDGPKCTCGSYGCLEALASGLFMKDYFISEIKRGASSIIAEKRSDIDSVSVHEIIEGLELGDRLCKDTVDKAGRHLGIGMANIINVYSPEMIVLGGDLTIMCPRYVKKAVETARSKAYPSYNKNISIVPTSFGEEMAAIGAVSVVYQRFFKDIENL